MPIIRGKFPEYEDVIPDDDDDDRVIVLDLNLLKRLHDAIPEGENGKQVKLRIGRNSVRAVKFETYGNDKCKASGLIMPVRMED